MMIRYFIQGLILGFAYVAPIGMQNIYVINSAINNKKIRVYETTAITILFDISLGLACFLGIGSVINKYIIFKYIVLLFGSIAVIYIGIKLIISVPDDFKKIDVNRSLIDVVITCFTVTWINPQAIIDGTLFLGVFKASLSYEASHFFISGFCTASFLWFNGLTIIVRLFRDNFNNKMTRKINIVCGTIIIYYGLKLGFNFISGNGGVIQLQIFK